MSFPSRYIFGILAVGLLLAGIFDYLKNFEDNGCNMTWMFEYPKYIKVHLDGSVTKKFPKYGLYIYGEGAYAQRVSTLKLRGVPVLFIPGNAGSHRQVRSLGSVALRKAEALGMKFEFNYFSVDFNEELVGVFGGVLQDQTEFVHNCIKLILQFYNGASNPPSSVILIGHSMGGLVARGLFTLPTFDPSLVTTIITQASPHQAPPVALDDVLTGFYDKINTYWRQHGRDVLRDVTVVSTGGGHRDILVRNDLTSLKGIVREDRGVSTCTMSVPKAWVSTDHLCAVWCHQMVLVTKRAMFDIIDPKTLQVTTDPDKRMRVFRHHFLSNPGSKKLTEELPGEITLHANTPWEVQDTTLFRYKEEKMSGTKYFAIPIIKELGELMDAVDSVVIISNITRDDWVCYCTLKEKQDRCTSCINLSAKAQSLPPLHSNKKVIRMYLEELGEATHIVIIAAPTSNKVEILVEQYKMIERHLVFNLPGIYDTIISYPVSVLDMAAMLQIRNNSVYYSLHLSGLEGPLRAYTANIIPMRCRKLHTADYEGIIYTLNVPWSNESTYGFAKYREKGVLPVKLQSAKPLDAGDDAVHLEMYLHPSCSYQLKLTTSPIHVMGQFIRFYGALYPCFFIGVLLLTLRGHFIKMAAGDPCSPVTEAVYVYGKPFKVVPLVLLFRFIASYKVVDNQLMSLGLPDDDKEALESSGLWFPALVPLMFVSAFLITLIQVRVLLLGVAFKSTTCAFIFRWVPQFVINLSLYVSICVCVVALVASFTVCGSVSIFLCYMVIGYKVLWLYKRAAVSKLKEDESKFNFFFTLIVIYLWLLALNGPALVIWAKNISFSMKLSPDPSQLTGAVTSIVTLLYAIDDNIDFNSTSCTAVGWTLYMIVAISLLYAMSSVYRLSYIIALALCVLGVTKLHAMAMAVLDPPKKKEE